MSSSNIMTTSSRYWRVSKFAFRTKTQRRAMHCGVQITYITQLKSFQKVVWYILKKMVVVFTQMFKRDCKLVHASLSKV